MSASLAFDNTYVRLPEEFYERVVPTAVAAPRLLRVNRPLAAHLGFDVDFLESPEGVEILAGNRVPAEAAPLAMAYAGHQFGHWVPQLGDGRAVLLGEVVDREGVRRDIQLKGAGRTPFSRRGDGRAGLGPVLREFVLSEAMAGLGIPTTRALAMVATGEPIQRERVEPGAILTRVAASHIRVGTFQYFYGGKRPEAIRTLADYVIARLAPEAAEAPNPHRALLDTVIRRQADLIADWMLVGFIHGVMNTDNTSISGETIDYGPCAFIDTYHPSTVYSSIDHAGRYAYDQQPGIGLWNLSRLAETLLALLAEGEEGGIAEAQAALDAYAPRFQERYQNGLRRKIGLAEAREGDPELVADLLSAMAEQKADFTLTFRRLSEVAASDPSSDAGVRSLFDEPEAFDAWARTWRARLAGEGRTDAERRRDMRATNPAFIPRNHRVQQAIDAAVEGDLGPFDTLLAVTTRPYDDHPEHTDHLQPPEPDEIVHQTFCGT